VRSVVDQSLDDNNEVFQGSTFSSSFTGFHSELRLRRATVAGDLSSGGLQSCFSTGDLPSLVDQQETGRKSQRPKSFFPLRGGGDFATNLRSLQSSDSSDLSDDLITADTYTSTEELDTAHG